MPVIFAFFGVVLIWGSTPLAIQWSLDDVAFSFAVLARMVLGLVVCLVAAGLVSGQVPLTRRAVLAYVAGGLGIFGAMSAVYWGSQFIPSGWVSVLFGLAPLITGVMAHFWLKERFGRERRVGTVIGAAGLAVIYVQGMAVGSEQTGWGVGAVLCGVGIFSASSILVKRLGSGIPPFATNTGSLAVAVPLFALVWMVDGGLWPQVLTLKAAGAIVYLGIAVSVVGGVLFYFVLDHLEASQTMLIPLLSPLVALSLGVGLNGEILDGRFLTGTGLILAGLATYQWGRLPKAGLLPRHERNNGRWPG